MDWGIAYYEAEDGAVLAEEFLESCPSKVDALIAAVLDAVRSAPPPAFSGGGLWEAMHGSMAGYYEIRTTGPPNRTHYRLFCILDNGTPEEMAQRGFDGPQIVAINGLKKDNATLFTDGEYAKHVRAHGARYRKTIPRPVAS